MLLENFVDLPYPNLSEIKKDAKVATMIAPTYASTHGELNNLLQYLYHYFVFICNGDVETANIIGKIVLSEMRHLKILGELLFKLGVNPAFTKTPPLCCNYYTSGNISYSKTPIKMLIDDVSSEIYSIKQYEKIVDCLTDKKVSAVIEKILIDEKQHLNVLNDRIVALGGPSVINFCIVE